MNIHPIRNDHDYNSALRQLETLWGADEGSKDADTLEVLVTLIEAYERQHHAIAPPDPIEAILFRMEQQGLTRKDLEPLLGSRSRVSEILGRKRPLTLAMIRRLGVGLGLSAGALIGPLGDGAGEDVAA